MDTDQFCTWRIEDEEANLWLGSCGKCWVFEVGDPDLNGFDYCPRCGGVVVLEEPNK